MYGTNNNLGVSGVPESLFQAFKDKYDISDDLFAKDKNFTYNARPRNRRLIMRRGFVYHPPFDCEKLALKIHTHEDDDDCPICLTELVDCDASRVTPCNHFLCKDCADACFPWPGGNCPICRRTVNSSQLKPAFDTSWLHGSEEEQWPSAYHGTASRNVASIFHDGLRIRRGRDVRHGTEFGEGIYVAPKITTAAMYATDAKVNGRNRNIIFIVRVKPDSIERFELNGHEVWVMRDEAHVRITGVLLH